MTSDPTHNPTTCAACGLAIWWRRNAPTSTLGSWYSGTSGTASASCRAGGRPFAPHKPAEAHR